MLESVIRAMLADKQVIIGAVAITVLLAYMLPGNMFAFAQVPPTPPDDSTPPIIIDQIIEIPCLPYCDVDDEPEPDERQEDNIITRFTYVFVPS
jgi:hypothetical protein